MKIAYITAGAAGMYCGSCMHDNTLVAALGAQGHDALLIPTYTPIRTDEIDVSQKRVFFGGINVYLQQRSRLFRRTPRWLDRLWNGPGLLRWVSRTPSGPSGWMARVNTLLSALRRSAWPQFAYAAAKPACISQTRISAGSVAVTR